MINWWKQIRDSLEKNSVENRFRTNVWLAVEGNCPFCRGKLQNHCFMELGGYQLPKTDFEQFIAQKLVSISRYDFSDLNRTSIFPLPIFELVAWRCDKEASPLLIQLIIPFDDADRWILVDSSREHGKINAPMELIESNEGGWICFGKRD